VDHIDYCFNVVHWCVLQNAVSEIEDMARSPIRPPHNIQHPLTDDRYGREQKYRIEIALDRTVMPNLVPRVIKVDSPIETDNIATRFGNNI
jgi:hypothetical protein